MRGWTPEQFHERDATHAGRSFESVLLSVGVERAATDVQAALPALGRIDGPGRVAFTSVHHGRSVVVAELLDRPGRPGSVLRYRRSYRSEPPLSMRYATRDGGRIYRVLEPYRQPDPARI